MAMTQYTLIDALTAILELHMAYPEWKPNVPLVRPMVEAFYALPGNGAGGYHLHVVLDDGNWEDIFVHSSVESAREAGDIAALLLAQTLLLLSPTQRRKL